MMNQEIKATLQGKVTEYINGNAEAFTEVYMLTDRTLRIKADSFIKANFGGHYPHTAPALDDMMSVVWTRLLKALTTYDAKQSQFMTFAYNVMTRTIKNEYSKANADVRTMDKTAGDIDGLKSTKDNGQADQSIRMAMTDHDAHKAFESIEMKETFQAVKDTLTEEEFKFFVAYYMNDIKTDALAELLGWEQRGNPARNKADRMKKKVYEKLTQIRMMFE